jgi:hypothetical protein
MTSPLGQAQIAHARKKYIVSSGDDDNKRKTFAVKKTTIEQDYEAARAKDHVVYKRKGIWSRLFGTADLEYHNMRKNTIKLLAEKEVVLFRTALIEHRHKIKYAEEVREFDEEWSLRMINARGSNAHTMQKRVGVKYCFSSRAEEVMKKQIELITRDCIEEGRNLKKLPPSLRGPELLRLFILDVIGRNTKVSQVIRHKLYKDVEHFVVSWTMKCVAIAMLFAINLYFVFTVLLYGNDKGYAWQRAWLGTFVVNVLIDVFFSGVVVAFFIHYWIPLHVAKDAGKVRDVLKTVVDQVFNNENFSGSGSDKLKFSASDYFFTSVKN